MIDNLVSFQNFSLVHSWLMFSALILTILVSAILIPKFLISTLQLQKQSAMLLGVLLLSLITSFPEILTTFLLPFSSSSHDDGVVKSFAQILGVNIFIGCFFCLNFFFLFKKLKTYNYSVKIKYSSLLTIIFVLFIILVFAIPEQNSIFLIFNSRFATIFLIVIYWMFVLFNVFKEQTDVSTIKEIRINLFTYQKRKSVLFCLTLILINLLVFGIVFLIRITEHLQTEYSQVDSTVVGLLFAIINASPEIWTFYTLVYYGFYGAGLGVIVGSFLFNLITLFTMDLFLTTKIWTTLLQEHFEVKLVWLCFLVGIVLLLSQFKIFHQQRKKYGLLILLLMGSFIIFLL